MDWILNAGAFFLNKYFWYNGCFFVVGSIIIISIVAFAIASAWIIVSLRMRDNAKNINFVHPHTQCMNAISDEAFLCFCSRNSAPIRAEPKSRMNPFLFGTSLSIFAYRGCCQVCCMLSRACMIVWQRG